MAKRSKINKTKKQASLALKFCEKRKKILKQIQKNQQSIELFHKLQKLPKNSSKTRQIERCFITGDARSVTRFCGLSRQSLRHFAKQGFLPGVTKSSW